MAHPFPRSGYTPPLSVDRRDFLLEKAQPVAPFPDKVITDISAIPVFFQDKISDCVENAITFIKKYHTYKNSGVVVDLCRRFLAILTVQSDGFPLSEGTNIHNALDIARNRGICETKYLSDDHTLDEVTFSLRNAITMEALTNATTHEIENYAFLSDLSVNGLKNAINQNGVVAVGALINQNWWTDRTGSISWDAADILPIRPPTTKDPNIDSSISGHAFVLYGYDTEYFYFVNSFGTDWGQQGKGYFKVDEVPFIYEAAVIIDLTPDQVNALKQTQQEIQQVEQVLPVANAAQQSLISQVITLIIKQISQILHLGA